MRIDEIEGELSAFRGRTMTEMANVLDAATAAYNASNIWISQLIYEIRDPSMTWLKVLTLNYIVISSVALLFIVFIIILFKKRDENKDSEYTELTEDEAKTYFENYRKFKGVCKELIDDIMNMDPAKRSRRIRENATNWLLGISVATLIVLIGNFNKFTIIDSNRSFMPYKLLFLLAILLLGISTFLLVYARKILYDQRIKIDESLDFINIIPDIQEQMNRENLVLKEIKGAHELSEEEIINLEVKIIENTWNDETCNCIRYQREIYRTHKPFKWGYRFYVVGLVTFIIYVFMFILHYT
jgi:Ca2+/Na+ antiporter